MFQKKRNVFNRDGFRNREAVILVFALLAEAKPFLRRLSAKGIHSQGNQRIFEFSGGFVLVTGVGKIASAIGVTAFSSKLALEKRQTSRIWNLGSSGAFDRNREMGSFHWIHKVTDQGSGQEEFPSFLEKIQPDMETSLLTLDSPLYSATSSLASIAQLVDMEGFGFFKAANLYFPTENIRIGKWVSDYLEPCSAEHLTNLAELHADSLLEQISVPLPYLSETEDLNVLLGEQEKLAEELGYTTSMIWEVKHYVRFYLNAKNNALFPNNKNFPPLPNRVKDKLERKKLHEAWKAELVL